MNPRSTDLEAPGGNSSMPDVITNASPPFEATDEALLLRIAQRERQALEQLYDRYSARVCGLALQLQPDRTRADEIVIETFWYVWKHADMIKTGAANVETWLPAIVRWMASAQGAAASDQNKERSPRSPLRKSDERKRARFHFSQR